jgi:LAS superfamily LD-carboxypeptidase LdcB
VSADLRELHPTLARSAVAFVDALRRAGLLVTITSTVRSTAKQRRLYEAYLARGRSGLPALPPGRSLHEHGLAFDMVLSPPLYRQAGALWRRFGGQWFPSDPVHFQAKQLLGR